jgi:uncharacterized iron-regulated protein
MPPIVKSAIKVALLCATCLPLFTGSVQQSQKTSCGSQETNTQTTTSPSPEILAVKESLEKHNLALIGEAHDDPEARNFIKDNLCALEIDTLYVEALTTDFQEKINNFDVDRNTKEDMRVLVMHSIGYENPRNDFSKLPQFQKDMIRSYVDFFWSVKQKGIDIVPLEDPSAKKNFKNQEDKYGELKSAEWRLATTNPLWASRIKEYVEKNPEKRGVALIGAGHQRLSFGVLGVSDFLRIPYTDISGSTLNWRSCSTLISPDEEKVQRFLSSASIPALESFDVHLKEFVKGKAFKDELDAFEMSLLRLDTPGLKPEYQKAVQERVDAVCTLQALEASKNQSR